MRDQPQLDLAVIGIEQRAALRRDKEPAHLPAERRAHGDILQIRLRGRNASGTRFGLAVAGVDPAVRRDRFQQSLDIGRAELCQLTVLQHQINDRVLVAEPFEHLRIRGPAGFGFLSGRQMKLLEQDHAELLRRKNVKFPPCLRINARLQIRDLGFQTRAELFNAFLVDAHAGMLHIREHLDQRQLDLPQQRLHALLNDLLLQTLRKCRQCYDLRELAECFRIGQRLHCAELLDRIFRHGRVKQIRADHGIQHEIVNRIALVHHHAVNGLCVKGTLRRIAPQKADDLCRVGQARGLAVPCGIQNGAAVQEIDRRFQIAERINVRRDDLSRTLLRLRAVRRNFRSGRRLDMQPLHQLIELQLGQQRRKRRGILRLFFVFRKRCRDRRIRHDRREPLALLCVLRAVFQLAAHGRFQIGLRQCFIECLDRPVLLNQRRCGLFADARDALDVIGAVAHERLQVDQPDRVKAVFRLKFRGIVQNRLFIRRKAHGHMRADQLQIVAVAGQQHAVLARVRTDLRERTEDIVRLPARAGHDRIAHGLQNLLRIRQLLGELLRHSLAVRLVAFNRLVPEGLFLAVKCNDDLLGFGIVRGAQQNIEKAVDRVCENALVIGQRLDAVKRTVQDAVSVHNHQFHGYAPFHARRTVAVCLLYIVSAYTSSRFFLKLSLCVLETRSSSLSESTASSVRSKPVL